MLLLLFSKSIEDEDVRANMNAWKVIAAIVYIVQLLQGTKQGRWTQDRWGSAINTNAIYGDFDLISSVVSTQIQKVRGGWGVSHSC